MPLSFHLQYPVTICFFHPVQLVAYKTVVSTLLAQVLSGAESWRSL